MTDDTNDTDDTNSSESTDGVWVFRLRPGKTSVLYPREPEIPDSGRRPGEQEYHVIEDPARAEAMKAKEDRHGPVFRWMEVNDALESAKQAVNAIEAGEYDDVLHLLSHAETEHYGSRKTVKDAIENRNSVLKERRAETDDSAEVLRPNDLVSAG